MAINPYILGTNAAQIFDDIVPKYYINHLKKSETNE